MYIFQIFEGNKGTFWGAYSRIGIVGISQTIVRSQATLIQSGCKTFIVTLLTGSDMSVINSGPQRIVLIIPAIPISE